MFVQTYFGFSVSVFMKDGVGTDEDKNADAHGEGPEHLHPFRVAVLLQEACERTRCLLGACIRST